MKIKTIEYKRLISTGNFSNESIGFHVDLEDGETPEKVIADLNVMIMNAHEYTVQLQTSSDMIKHLAENNETGHLQQYLNSLAKLMVEHKQVIEQFSIACEILF